MLPEPSPSHFALLLVTLDAPNRRVYLPCSNIATAPLFKGSSLGPRGLPPAVIA